jgi:hypothetical protein
VPFPMQRIDQLSGGREPFCRGNILWCWTHCGQMAPLGARPAPCLRPRPCIDPYDTNACRRITKPTRHLQRAQARSGNHCGRRAGHHPEGWPAATRRRRWRSALTIATARRREPRCATEATDVRPIVVPSATRFGAHSALPWEVPVCASRRIVANGMSLWFFSVQHARR